MDYTRLFVILQKLKNGLLKMRSAIQIVKCIRKLQRDDERERRRGRF